MTLPLDQVTDLDCVLSFSPLVVDLPDTERYVSGLAAIARRALYAWIADGALLDLDGGSFDDADLLALRSAYQALAEDENYILSAPVSAELHGGALVVASELVFIDGRAYTMEVTSAEAVTVNFEAA